MPQAMHVNEVRRVILQTTNEEWAYSAGSVKAGIFGQMVEMAEGVVEHYRSDLFHDATWLQDRVDGTPLTFEFLVRPWGTNVSEARGEFRETEGNRLFLFRYVPLQDGSFTIHQLVIARLA